MLMARPRTVSSYLFALLLLAGTALAAPPKSLQDRITATLSSPDLARGFWGVEVVSLSSGQTLYSLNPDKLFTPASNTKLFTTAAALALIGPDYKFRTTVETAATLDRYGPLNADLLLLGHRAPNLPAPQFPY